MFESLDQLTALSTVLRRHGWDRAAFAAPDYMKMRFRLGTSIAETKIPYGLSPELQTLVRKAADKLLAAVATRHREKLNAVDMDKVLMDEASVDVSLRPEFWYVGDLPPNTIFHTIVTRSLRRNRLLDAGILFWWLGKEEIGRRLVGELQTVVRKLAGEQEYAEGEPTLHFGLRALTLHLTHHLPGMPSRIADPLIREGCNATAVVLYETFLAVLEEHFRPSGAPGKPVDDETALEWYRLTLPLSPRAFLSESVRFGLHTIGPDGMSEKVMNTLERYFPRMTDRNTPAPEIVKQLVSRIAGDKNGAPLVLGEERVRRLFDATLTFLASVRPPDKDAPEAPAYREIVAIHTDPDKLLRILDEKKAWREWLDNWKRMQTAGIKAPMERFTEQVSVLPKLTTGFLADKALLQSVYTDFAERFVLLRHAELFDQVMGAQGKVLHESPVDNDRRREDHAGGRLYLISTGENPTLSAAVAMEEGQLFVDLKDFTKRTFAAKEVKMADFMKWEFYEPILKLAKKYLVGMRHIDRAGIQINNLLGDAISASGDVVSLLQFSRELMTLADDYKAKIPGRVPEEMLTSRLQEIDAAFKARHRALVEERNRYVGSFNTLNGQLKALPQGDPKRQQLLVQLRGFQEAVNAVERQMQAAEQAHAEQRATITGTGLEAGVFVSYGSAAETVTFQDEIFGHMKVAIGEKINESARGTARDPIVFELLNHHVTKARKASGNKAMEYPFRVYIDDTIYGPLEPDLAEVLQKAIDERDVDGAKKVVQSFSQRLMNDLVPNLKKEAPDFRMLRLGNGIYNLGIALGEDALEKYLATVESERRVLRRALKIADLHEEIKRAFVFPRDSYEIILVEGEDPARPEIFVRLGAVLFKGFEKKGKSAVYEDLRPASLFYRLFLKHHARDWLAAEV